MIIFITIVSIILLLLFATLFVSIGIKAWKFHNREVVMESNKTSVILRGTEQCKECVHVNGRNDIQYAKCTISKNSNNYCSSMRQFSILHKDFFDDDNGLDCKKFLKRPLDPEEIFRKKVWRVIWNFYSNIIPESWYNEGATTNG